MIISPQRQFIFVHIPKTGGTSMALALEARAARDDILIGDTPKAQRRKGRLKGVETRGRLWKHSTLADVEGLVSRDDMAAWFVFTLVRNPWDRMVSYYHWLQAQTFEHPAVMLASTVSFEDFVLHPQTEAAFRASPYGHYLTDSRGVSHADAFLRLEHLAEDMAPLEAHLGFRPDLPVANASARQRDWRGYYSAESAARVADLSAQDNATFGYHFDP